MSDKFGKAFQDFGATANDASRALKELGEAMAKVDFPPLLEIAIMRMDKLREELGYMRFFIPEWWRWWFFSKKY